MPMQTSEQTIRKMKNRTEQILLIFLKFTSLALDN